MVNQLRQIGIIGGGNMGAAIINGIHKQCLVSVAECDAKKAQALKRKYRVRTVDLKTVCQSDVIILAVKPQDFEGVLQEIRRYISKRPLIISIAAGITTPYIEKTLKNRVRVVRAMPNLPLQIGEGMTALCAGKYATGADLAAASQIFARVGKVVVVGEKSMNAVTAVSGSGPAYVFLFAEMLGQAARSLGLKEDLANQLVLQTLKGSVKLLEQAKEPASVLRARVTSKGGTTQAALNVFVKHKLEKIFTDALRAASNRARELSR